jgi:hypothetical protein
LFHYLRGGYIGVAVSFDLQAFIFILDRFDGTEMEARQAHLAAPVPTGLSVLDTYIVPWTYLFAYTAARTGFICAVKAVKPVYALYKRRVALFQQKRGGLEIILFFPAADFLRQLSHPAVNDS